MSSSNAEKGGVDMHPLQVLASLATIFSAVVTGYLYLSGFPPSGKPDTRTLPATASTPVSAPAVVPAPRPAPAHPPKPTPAPVTAGPGVPAQIERDPYRQPAEIRTTPAAGSFVGGLMPAPAGSTSPSAAPSFDCAKASWKSEKLVCSSTTLSALDVRMADLYRSALNRNPDLSKEMRNAQNYWLRRVRESCDDVRCLEALYRQRILELQNS